MAAEQRRREAGISSYVGACCGSLVYQTGEVGPLDMGRIGLVFGAPFAAAACLLHASPQNSEI